MVFRAYLKLIDSKELSGRPSCPPPAVTIALKRNFVNGFFLQSYRRCLYQAQRCIHTPRPLIRVLTDDPNIIRKHDSATLL